MLEELSRTKRNLALLGVALVVALAAWKIRAVINPLILGYLLAFILQPLVSGLERRGLRRSGAVLTVFGSAFSASLLLGFGVLYQGRVLIETLRPEAQAVAQADGQGGALLVEDPMRSDRESGDRESGDRESGELESGTVQQGAAEPVDGEPGGVRSGDAALGSEPTGQQRLERLRTWLEERLGPEWVPPSPSIHGLVEFLGESSEAREVAGQAGAAAATSIYEGLRGFFGGVFGLSTLALMVPVYAFFWLFEMGRLNEYVRRHLPVRHRQRLTALFVRLGEVLSVFFRGRLTVCLLKGLFLTVGLVVAQIPYALLLGLGGGFLSIVPFLGGIAAFVFALLVALSAHSLVHALVATTIVFALAELLEGYVLMPRILGDSLGLSDVAVLFAITAGGAFLGLLGVLLALPLAAAIKILYLEFVEPALEQFAEEDDEGAVAPG
jgi:predicted PurR-regulated permease PerM